MAQNIRRAFIIHGWDGHPEEGCFPWLKKELEARGFSVIAPAMPNPLEPRIEEWVPRLAELVGTPDEHMILFGHSIGAQTILRYLAGLPEGKNIKGAVLLAPWVHLTNEAFETDEDREIAEPWLKTPIDFGAARQHAGKFTAIFSDSDPLVPIGDAKIFERELGAGIIMEHDKGHFSGSDGITEFPSALQAVLDIAGACA